MEREKILRHAMQRMQGLALVRKYEGDKPSEGDKRSLFSVLASLLDCAGKEDAGGGDAAVGGGDVLANHRIVVERVRRLADGKRFMGAKSEDLKAAVEALFCDGQQVLDKGSFGAYTHGDLMGYVEICRRVLMGRQEVGQQGGARPVGARPVVAQPVGARPMVARQEVAQQAARVVWQGEPKAAEKAAWRFDQFGILAIHQALAAGDVACAMFVVENQPKRRDGNVDKVVGLAKRILARG